MPHFMLIGTLVGSVADYGVEDLLKVHAGQDLKDLACWLHLCSPG